MEWLSVEIPRSERIAGRGAGEVRTKTELAQKGHRWGLDGADGATKLRWMERQWRSVGSVRRRT